MLRERSKGKDLTSKDLLEKSAVSFPSCPASHGEAEEAPLRLFLALKPVFHSWHPNNSPLPLVIRVSHLCCHPNFISPTFFFSSSTAPQNYSFKVITGCRGVLCWIIHPVWSRRINKDAAISFPPPTLPASYLSLTFGFCRLEKKRKRERESRNIWSKVMLE